MRADRFTTKSMEAFDVATGLAAARRHTEVLPEHLLAVLLEQQDSIVPPVLRKLGVEPATVRADLNAALDTLATVSAGTEHEPATSRELLAVLRAAESEAGKLGDEYISTEHLLLALTEVQGPAGEALRRNGAARDAAPQAVEATRGPHRVTDPSPEDKYQALEKFGRDLTIAARDGKLDPVIGRD